ncbi:MAG: hypothetical protein LBT79_03665 [Elusimicrobiota bacterium]|jgi:hypothetical protein|nr:hypothetical protein [Elusimicrobiota bacterium]
MAASVKIFVEGIADKKFMSDYLAHIMPSYQIDNEMIIDCSGWTSRSEFIKNEMKYNTDNGAINLVIFDADKSFSIREQEIKNILSDSLFELFLFPNNKDAGTLEDLLEQIIVEKNKPIFDCWNAYEICLKNKQIAGYDKPLTVPAKKTKIYAYLEALLGSTKEEKRKIKEKERNYRNKEHWNLDSKYLESLKIFLLDKIKEI